jgi:hypothetical protein
LREPDGGLVNHLEVEVAGSNPALGANILRVAQRQSAKTPDAILCPLHLTKYCAGAGLVSVTF